MSQSLVEGVYKPGHISIADAITYTSSLSDRMKKNDLRIMVSYGDDIEFVGTDEFLGIIRRRIAEVDVEALSPSTDALAD
jgi:hypothetical protein